MSIPSEYTPESNYLLLTGSTGLLGRYLMKDLLLAGVPLAVLVRSTRRQSALERIESIVSTWERQLDRSLPRPDVVEGNLSEESLGISDSSCEWIRDHCSAVIHNAASLSFANNSRDAEPWKTNLTGTSYLLDFCKKSEIEEFHHISTAYVCGTRQDEILEGDLEEGQSFSNDYEWSKLEAEKLVRAADFLKSTTIYRPSIIVGDSETGFTTTFHGIYAILQLGHLICKGIQELSPEADPPRLRINLDGTEQKNLVPVNWVSEVVSHIVTNAEYHNNCYHLTPRETVDVRTLMNSVMVATNTLGVAELAGSDSSIENPNDLEQMFYQNIQVYNSYWKNDPEFDTTNTQAAAPHLPCPTIDGDLLIMLGKAAIAQDFRWRDQPVRSEASATS